MRYSPSPALAYYLDACMHNLPMHCFGFMHYHGSFKSERGLHHAHVRVLIFDYRVKTLNFVVSPTL